MDDSSKYPGQVDQNDHRVCMCGHRLILKTFEEKLFKKIKRSFFELNIMIIIMEESQVSWVLNVHEYE